MDAFGEQNHLIQTYSQDNIRRGISDIGHLDTGDIVDLLQRADAAVIRDPSQVSGKVLKEIDSANYSRQCSDGFSYRGIYTGDEELVADEILYSGENLETGERLLME